MPKALPILAAAAALAALVIGLCLPSRSEVERSAWLAAPPEAVLARLAELPFGPAWSTWEPSRSDGLLATTAEGERGVWFDVAGRRRHKAAVQVRAEDGGTRVTWTDVLHLSGDPLGRLTSIGRQRRVGDELEASLANLAAELAARPAGPPPVVVVLIDDLGWELLRAAPTPNLDAMAAAGTTFTNLWVTPKCGPTRASLLTGRFHFRIGGGEIARRHPNRSMGLEELTLPEVLGPELSACFGKWHLSTDPGHPNASGFGYFAGSLGNLNGHSYHEWPKVVNGETSTCTRYATTDVTDEALASRAEFKLVAYHAVHTPFHEPPAELAPTAPAEDTDEARLLAMTEALDTELGRLLRAHGDAVVFVLGDNGTTGLVGGEKGLVSEWGINVPLIVRGPGVRRGAVTPALVSVVDLFATIAELRGVEASTEDSISFAPVLRGEPGTRAWNYACLFWEATPGRRIHAIRDAEYKLVVAYDRTEELFRMPGEEPVPLEGAPPEVLERARRLRELCP